LLKFLLAVAIIVAVGRRFALDLQGHSELFSLPLRPCWLIGSALLYLLALGCSALYWHRLLQRLGQTPTPLSTIRAYYVGQLGKYLPGKAWALFIRSAMATRLGVSTGVALASSFYEVLTTMSVGALLSAVVFVTTALGTRSTILDFDWYAFGQLLMGRAAKDILLHPLVPGLLALILLALVGPPILPPIFNRIVGRIARSIRTSDVTRLPRFSGAALAEGLVLMSGAWFLFGASLWAVLQGMLDRPTAWSWSTWLHYTAYIGLAYVAGFIILVIPSGLGVRELLLTPLLASELERSTEIGADSARFYAVTAVLLTRLVWTAAEMVIAGVVYWMHDLDRNPDSQRRSQPLGTAS
jgi:uncharacterized membrane protein YbhN (UPF0104 family)